MDKLLNDMIAYRDKYASHQTEKNAQVAVDIFLENKNKWSNVMGNLYGRHDGDKIYGNTLVAFSAKLWESNAFNEEKIIQLSQFLDEYVDKVLYNMSIKSSVFYNIALCWCKMGLQSYRDKALESFKKYIFFQLAFCFNTSYCLDCYGFKPCSQYTYHNLINERLTVTSSSRFNDPFDCPLIELLQLKGDETEQLIKEAYLACTKVACFSKNDKLPVPPDFKRKKKHKGDDDEFLNTLMWAHYADSHKGICIKYHFNNSITQLYKNGLFRLTYFQDVKYSDSIHEYGSENSINIDDAFFLKSKVWEYENEVRMHFFDINSKGDYDFVDIPNSISAIYFGLKCSELDRESIIKILRERKWIKKVSRLEKGKRQQINEEHDIEFYQMEMDNDEFGKLKAVEIKPL